MRKLLFALGALTVATLVSSRSADAGFFVSGYPRVGVIVGAPCAPPVFPIYAPSYYPYYNAPFVSYPTAYYYPPSYYPRPSYGLQYRDDDYGRRVVGYTFPGRR